ncbi:MAG TPA: hypothetical protein VKG78_00775 [Opitutaceae bacterium]|nr:hypothetical protein [Opitutaceae bacterium]
MSHLSLSVLACTGALLASAAARAEPAVIGLARAYLGPDSTLDAITSVHFFGRLERVDPDHPDKSPLRGTIDLIFVKPFRQRQVVRVDEATETTVLDGYDAWDLLQDNADPSKHVLTWLSAADVKSIRASTWENLYFYRGLKGDGAVEDKGPATIEGTACERVDFSHGSGIIFERYFDRDTGRLVLTMREPEVIRESGEIQADGIRFPKTVVSVRKTASGKELTSTVTFDKVVLNEQPGADVFAVPSLLPSKAPRAPAGPQAK